MPSPDDAAGSKIDLGHPPEYFDALLAQAEADAYASGLRWGGGASVTAAVASAAAWRARLRVQGQPFRLYHSLLVVSRAYRRRMSSDQPDPPVVGLVSSQLAIHRSFLLDQQLIVEQQRREAFWRAEQRRRIEHRRIMAAAAAAKEDRPQP
ncbi:hypothetical protein HK405_008733 [Cladochytrium tenue]|nr:hypothetical protein HK405_008733 [Cladochytrium tenue]